MTSRYFQRRTRDHSRQRGVGSDAFDRLMDCRERHASRHSAGGACVVFRFAERAEIERRSLLDVMAPARS